MLIGQYVLAFCWYKEYCPLDGSCSWEKDCYASFALFFVDFLSNNDHSCRTIRMAITLPNAWTLMQWCQKHAMMPESMCRWLLTAAMVNVWEDVTAVGLLSSSKNVAASSCSAQTIDRWAGRVGVLLEQSLAARKSGVHAKQRPSKQRCSKQWF